MDPLRTIKCETHGDQSWRGDLVCRACGWVFPGSEVAVPDLCPNCRARLLPDPADPRIPWTGRAECPECAKDPNSKRGETKMAIETTNDDDDADLGRLLYDVLRARVASLRTGDQVSLGIAIQRGTQWASLSEDQRQAFAAAAEDLEL